MRDFLFYPSFQQQLTLYSHFFDYTRSKIFVQNDVNYSIQISKHHKLRCLTKIPYKNCFTTSVDRGTAATPPTSSPLFHERYSITIPLASINLKTELPNSVKIYKNKKIVEEITCLINKHPAIWESSRFV